MSAPDVQPDFSRRAIHLREVMDDPSCDEQLLFKTYRQFTLVNRLLSRWRTIYLRRLRPRMRQGEVLRLLDIGFGGGDILRALHAWSVRDGLRMVITAIDPDERSHRYVMQQAWPVDVQFVRKSTEDLLHEGQRFDVVISNHLLHHLPDDGLVKLADDAVRLAKRLALFGDIERSAAGYRLFNAMAWPFLRRSYAFEDGLISIRRSFTRDELAGLLPAGWVVERCFPLRLLAWYDHERSLTT